jgi:hypothetical protein
MNSHQRRIARRLRVAGLFGDYAPLMTDIQEPDCFAPFPSPQNQLISSIWHLIGAAVESAVPWAAAAAIVVLYAILEHFDKF